MRKLRTALLLALVLMLFPWIAVQAEIFCDTCGKWTEVVDDGYVQYTERHHSRVLKCTTCGKRIRSGIEPHTGGTATCTQKAVCTACGASYGELDSNNHQYGAPTIIPATCTSGKLLQYTLDSGETILTIAFEVGGKLVKTNREVRVTLPASVLCGGTLCLLNADGMEVPLTVTAQGENIVLTLNFKDAPLFILHVHPAA